MQVMTFDMCSGERILSGIFACLSESKDCVYRVMHIKKVLHQFIIALFAQIRLVMMGAHSRNNVSPIL